MTDPNVLLEKNLKLVTQIVRKQGPIGIRALVPLLVNNGLPPDYTYEAVRFATQRGYLKLDGQMRLTSTGKKMSHACQPLVDELPSGSPILEITKGGWERVRFSDYIGREYQIILDKLEDNHLLNFNTVPPTEKLWVELPNLTQEQVKQLLPYLIKFSETGEFK